ncbi:MAG TPA: glycosyltransferase [Candidatus Saccharimonadales bacterium]|nr:glycosyltransferase [Candidatus Saccharimonadales bacterium]
MPYLKKPAKQLLSLVIPAYKQEKTIKKDITRIAGSLSALDMPYEIIVVLDGKLDKTEDILKNAKLSKVKVVGYEHNHGKGYAVRYGMAHAKGTIIAFLDAGMDLHPRSIQIMLDEMEKHRADIVIGSKLHPLSAVSYPWQRKVLSWGYRTLVKTLFGLSITDTQVGLKMFRRKVLEDVMPRLIVKQFAFDIEILSVANYLGYSNIQEAPIELKYATWSSITSKSFWRIVSLMVWDTIAVFYRLRMLHYYDSKSKRKWKFDPELNFRINVV